MIFMKIPLHVRERRKEGSMLMEVAVGFGVLIVVSLLLLKLSMIALSSRSWIVKQTLSDAYCTREIAYAKRIPFDDLTSNASPWPTYPTIATTTVTLGTLGRGAGDVTGTLKRYKEPMSNNLATQGGTGSTSTNPAAINSYLIQSVLTYQINGKDYYKTRSAIRTQ